MAPGPTQILIIALIILLLFGATRLSEIGKGLGEGIRNFKKGIQDEDEAEAQAEKKRLEARKAKAAEDGEESPREDEKADERA